MCVQLVSFWTAIVIEDTLVLFDIHFLFHFSYVTMSYLFKSFSEVEVCIYYPISDIQFWSWFVVQVRWTGSALICCFLYTSAKFLYRLCSMLFYIIYVHLVLLVTAARLLVYWNFYNSLSNNEHIWFFFFELSVAY